jgi:hypothetical protein
MTFGKNLLLSLLFLTILLVVIQSTNKTGTNEGYISYNGILPKDNHIDRIDDIIYYNDPIFIEYSTPTGDSNASKAVDNASYVLLKVGENKKAVGTKKDALTQVAYIKPTKAIRGLSPVPYMEKVRLEVYPDADFNKKFNMEFMIVPYETSVSSQQPYLKINDYISFKTTDNKYLCVNPLDLSLELFETSTVPNNGLFRISNSPQCYVNYVKYGVDTRKQNLDTIQQIVQKMKKELEIRLKAQDGDSSSIRELRKREADLRDSIDKHTNNKSYIENQMNILKSEHQGTLDNIRDKHSTIKLDANKDFENRILAEKNMVDSFYLKEMKAILDKGCTK